MLSSNLSEKSSQKILVPAVFFNLHVLGGNTANVGCCEGVTTCRHIQAGLASPGHGAGLCHSQQLWDMLRNCDCRIWIEKNIKLHYRHIFQTSLDHSFLQKFYSSSKIKWLLLCSIVMTELVSFIFTSLTLIWLGLSPTILCFCENTISCFPKY